MLNIDTVTGRGRYQIGAREPLNGTKRISEQLMPSTKRMILLISGSHAQTPAKNNNKKISNNMRRSGLKNARVTKATRGKANPSKITGACI